MKKNIKTRILASVLATVCALSAGAAVTTVSASAASIDTVSVAASNKACAYTMNGCNWTYWLNDNDNVDIKGHLDFSNGTCEFIIKGLRPGVVNAVLKTKNTNGTWNNVPIRFTVDNQLNVTGEQTGAKFITQTQYEG